MTDHEGKPAARGARRPEAAATAPRGSVTTDSERALATLLSNLPGMAYRCRNDADWTMEFVSDASLALTGYLPDELIENRRVAYGSLIHPDDQEAVWEEVQSALAAGRQFQSTYRLITASGEEKCVWEQGQGVGLTAEGILVIEGLMLDITAQRRLEERIAASEQKFRALYERANDAIFLIRDGVIVECNPKTEEVFGRPREGVVGRGPEQLSPPEQPDGVPSSVKAAERLALAYSGERQFFEWKHVRPDGTPFDAEVSLSAVDVEGGTAVLAIIRDVTERKQAYALLEQRVAERTAEVRANEARYRGLFERSRDAVFIATNARLVDVNPAALELLGASRADIVGRPVDDFLAPGERLRINEAVDAGGGSVKDFEIGVRRLDGTLLDCLLTGHIQDVVVGNDGFEGILRDVTEWKRAEEDLFEQTRERAVLDERNRLAREIHDTIAQGLTGIVLQLEAAEQAGDETSPEAEAHIERAKALARESLQEARRSVWNLVPHALQSGDLPSALEAEVRRFAARGGGRPRFEVTGLPRALTTEVEVALLRICQEALMNVRKHAQARDVLVHLAYEAHATRLIIEDDGVGFAPGHSAPGSPLDGGFGLRSMDQRARQYGGRLLVESAPGAGARVTVAIPTEAGATEAGPGEASTGGSPR